MILENMSSVIEIYLLGLRALRHPSHERALESDSTDGKGSYSISRNFPIVSAITDREMLDTFA